MAEGEEYIQLQIEDDFPAIRRHLSRAGGERVFLLVPPDCVGLNGDVQLRLLSRVLSNAPYRLALVTSDWSLFKRAERAGIAAFLSLEQAKESPPENWAKPRPVPGSLLRKRRPQNVSFSPQRGEVMLLVSLAGGLAILALLLGFLFFPEAEIIISPLTSRLERNFAVIVDPLASEVNEEELTIPGQMLEVELLGKEGMPTTARKDQPSTTAEGEVVFINLTAEPVIIPKGTVVSTSGGINIRFQTKVEANLAPGYGQQLAVPIAAMEPGPAGNVPALAINRVEGGLSYRLRVINNQATSGGTAVQVPYVTLEDKNLLKGRLMQRLQQEGYTSLASQLVGQLLLPGYPELIVLAETYDHAVGDESGALNLELRVLARGIAIREMDLSTIAFSLVQAQAESEIQILPQGMEFILGEPREEDEKIILPLTVRAQSMPRFDEVQIKNGILGQPIPQALEYIFQELSLTRQPQVEVNPVGWPFMPWLPARIQISINLGGG
ncbi:MAG: baseplate J/gp47 family protein [Chloroflexi bacterium]|nr:baseplate J/gp47 family protein [Chloroflexota bacterium]